MIELAPAPTATLRFLTVAELREQTPARPAWLWDTNIAAGNLTLLIGKPKAGKSTLALGLATALPTGAASFLGCDIHASPVVYISEEAGGTLLHKLPDDGAHMHILTRDSAWPKPDWPQLVQLGPTRGGATLGPPKSSRSRRTVALDAATVAPLRDHLAAQLVERTLAGDAYVDRDLVFAGALGGPIHPQRLTEWFGEHRRAAGIPSGSLHTLRHTAATLAPHGRRPCPHRRGEVGRRRDDGPVDVRTPTPPERRAGG